MNTSSPTQRANHQQPCKVSTEFIAALDLGGSNIRGAWVDMQGQIGAVKVSPRPQSLEGTKAAVLKLLRTIVDEAPSPLVGVGLASAGPMDQKNKRYLKTTNMPELDFFPVGDFILEEIGLPVVLENDAQAAALGEVFCGGLAGERDALVLTLGTGVGSGVILDGKLWRAAHITGPELGHVYLGPGRGKRCGCGQRGCAETWLNKEALMSLAAEYGVPLTSLRDLDERLASRDERALNVLEAYGHRLGLYFSSLLVIYGVKKIGLSGGLSRLAPYFLAGAWDTMAHRFIQRPWLMPESISISPDPEMSALWGMARLWNEHRSHLG